MQNSENFTHESGGFLSFVLLDSVDWFKDKLINDLKKDWDFNISAESSDEEGYGDVFVADISGMRLAVGFMGAPVPNGEAEHFASANYMWKEAVSVTKKQKAHIIIAILGDAAPKEKGLLLVKAVSSCLKQHNAIAVFSDGIVYEPKMYTAFSEMIRKGSYPVFDLVWFGMYHDKEKHGFYTFGMRKFGFEEMEIYASDPQIPMSELHEFVIEITGYVLDSEVTLHEGETIGLTEEQKLPISFSDGIAVDGKTLKIDYE